MLSAKEGMASHSGQVMKSGTARDAAPKALAGSKAIGRIGLPLLSVRVWVDGPSSRPSVP